LIVYTIQENITLSFNYLHKCESIHEIPCTLQTFPSLEKRGTWNGIGEKPGLPFRIIAVYSIYTIGHMYTKGCDLNQY